MIMPAIFLLVRRGPISPTFRLIGFARAAMTDDEFRAKMRESVRREAAARDEAAWLDFAARLSYITSEFDATTCRATQNLRGGSSNSSAELRRMPTADRPILSSPRLASALISWLLNFRTSGAILHRMMKRTHGGDRVQEDPQRDRFNIWRIQL